MHKTMLLPSFDKRFLRPCLIWTSLLLLGMRALDAQVVYEQVHSFGASADSGAYPNATPLIGLDGRLYGSTLYGGSAGAGTLYRVERNGSDFVVLHNFSGFDGSRPIGGLAQDEAGVLYGAAAGGGYGTNGVVFKINPDGSDFAVIKELAADGSEGREPAGGLVRASNGVLYGATFSGGAYDGGTIFSVNTDGTEFTVLRELGDSPADARGPRCFLIEGSDGMLYGTTRYGGTEDAGTLFRITKFSFGYEVLKSFVPATEGQGPLAGVIEGRDGRLYGTLGEYGLGDAGAVYAINPDGTGFTILRSLVPSEGAGILAGVCQTSDGMLYVIASSEGANLKGSVMRFREDGSEFSVVQDFGTSPGSPSTGITALVEGSDGELYYTTALGGAFDDGTVARMQKDGSGLQILRSFSESGSAAITPREGVVVGKDGILYGTTVEGGINNLGTVYRIRADGSGYGVLRVLGQSQSDAALPVAGLIQASDGFLYGTATAGGTHGQGALFRVAPDAGGYAVVYSFRGKPADGAVPSTKLLEAKDGFLYGTTSYGGSSNNGTIFRIRKDGTEYTVLRSFGGAPNDASNPNGDLLQTSEGLIYGVTYIGGSANLGTVFRLNPDGSGYSVVRSFTGALQTPANPWSGLIEGSDGRLYGTSLATGGNGGSVYSLAKDGTDLRVIVALPKAVDGGTRPLGRLVEDSTGQLWGICWLGGPANGGTVFKVAKDGSGYQVAHEFLGAPADGFAPISSLAIFSDGVIYGTTTSGGTLDFGSLFRISSSHAVHIEGVSKQPDGPATVSISAVPGWLCQLEWTSEVRPSAWNSVVTGRANAAGKLVLTDVAANDQAIRFYRVRATPSTADQAN